MKGKIIRVMSDKGFGFIRAENGVEFFFHHSALLNGNFDDATVNREVEFDPEEGEKGPRAENVTL